MFAGSYDGLLTHLIPGYPLAQSTADEVADADAMCFPYLAEGRTRRRYSSCSTPLSCPAVSGISKRY